MPDPRGARAHHGWFEIRAQVQYAGDDPERWRTHADASRDLGATHLAIATHNAGDTDVDGHLRRIAEYRETVGAVVWRACSLQPIPSRSGPRS